jgi:GNAT superfamily N-acetyltransferase
VSLSEVVVETAPLETPGGQALVAALMADLDERYAADGPGLGDDAETVAAWAVRPEQVTEPNGVFVLAYLDSEVVGCGAVRPVPGGPADVAEIKRMYTAPAARRRGVSRAVLLRLESEAARLGYRRLQLETGHRQPEAVALYEGEGYHRITPYGQYAGDELSICYAKDL